VDLGRERYALLTDDNSVEVPLLLMVYELAGVDVLVDEERIEHTELRNRRRPGRAVERGVRAFEPDVDLRSSGGPEGDAASDVVGVARPKRPKDIAEGCLTAAIFGVDEG